MQRIIKVALFFFLVFVCTLGIQAQNKPTATLKGKVTDGIDALVPFMPIAFKNEVRSYKIKTNDDGEYELALEPGKYKVLVEASMGFGAIRRSEILLMPDSSMTLNLRVYPVRSILVEISDGSMECMSGYYYQDIPALSTVGVIDGVVRYGWNEKKKSLLIFKPFLKHDDQVVFTYDFFSVSADQIRVDTQKKEVYAIGNVTIELEIRKKNTQEP